MTDQANDNGKAPRHDPELAARFRAAFAYKGLKPKDVAAALGISGRSVYRLENGQAEIDRDLRDRVVELTGVPPWFMERGYAGPESEDPELVERTEALEQQMATVLRILSTRAAVGSGGSQSGQHGGPEGGTGRGPQP